MAFLLNDKQRLANDAIASDAAHIMLYGGSRSGKSFIAVRALVLRAMLVPGSRHLIARFRLSHVKASIVADTLPKVLQLCFPQLYAIMADMHSKSENHFILPNGSEIWYAGLDDKDRTEKILGMEFATILLEEASQIPWGSRETLITRLAQKTSRPNPEDMDGKKGLPRLPGLRLKAFYCENPPLKSHWTYKLFIEHVSPDTGKRVPNPENYASLQMNPQDNKLNIAPGYIDELMALGERKRKRFLEGQFGEAGESALWTYELIEQQRLDEDDPIDLERFVRIVVAVDPSGADNIDDATRDEIGIVAAGIRADGVAVVLEDATMKGSPGEWGQAVVQLYVRWGADRVVGEENYGGAMVKFVVQAAAIKENITVPYRAVTATRGKTIRAEPISALYEAQKVQHAPGLTALEDELVQMTTFGYTGDKSPNRADACLIGTTLVETSRGPVPIRDVRVGELVLTRKGYRRVLESMMTRDMAETFTVAMSDGRTVTGTAEHPVFVQGKGFVRVDALVCGDIIEPVENWSEECQRHRSSSNWMASFTRGIQTARTARQGSITSQITTSITGNSGKSIRAKSLMGFISTIRIWTRSIINSTILSRFLPAITRACISISSAPRLPATILIPSDTSPLIGTVAMRGALGTASMPSRHGLIGNGAMLGNANAAVGQSSPETRRLSASALASAAGQFWTKAGDMSGKFHAWFAELSTGKTSIEPNPKPARVSVAQVSVAAAEPVFNLEVEGEHEFFANGVLVHNCVWALTDLFPSVVRTAKSNQGDASRHRAPKVNLGHSQFKRRH